MVLSIGFSKYQPIFADSPKNGTADHSSAVTSGVVSLLGEKIEVPPHHTYTCLTSQLQYAPLERGSLLVS